MQRHMVSRAHTTHVYRTRYNLPAKFFDSGNPVPSSRLCGVSLALAGIRDDPNSIVRLQPERMWFADKILIDE